MRTDSEQIGVTTESGATGEFLISREAIEEVKQHLLGGSPPQRRFYEKQQADKRRLLKRLNQSNMRIR